MLGFVNAIPAAMKPSVPPPDASAPELPDALNARVLQRLLSALGAIRAAALQLEAAHAADIEAIEPAYRASARNLLHYLGVRRHDIRALQADLVGCGLSSLSNMESSTLASIDSVLANLARLTGSEVAPHPPGPVDLRTGPLLLADHARALLGPPPQARATRIMVTMPSEAAHDPQLVRELLEAGMDVMRINCAHDDAASWKAMARHLRAAERQTGRHCRIQVDLAGPKLRTGALRELGQLLKLRPERDAFGRVVRSARIELVGAETQPVGTATRIGVSADIVRRAADGDRLRVKDARGKTRELPLRREDAHTLVAELGHSLYLQGGAVVELWREDARLLTGSVGKLPAVAPPIELHRGDTLLLTRTAEPGCDAVRDAGGKVESPARIHCTLDAAFLQVRKGEPVWFDDGRIGGVVEANDGGLITVRITHAGAEGSRLRAEKGINFPETQFALSALTDKDIADLEAVVGFADIVALSFVRSAADVACLEDHLHRLGAGQLGIVLKIENRQAFENLPGVLLAGLRSPPVGVMVARGDLAVELGFERLSEVQEEILWLCEAAHVPVIWATQMLEGLAKKGVPSRAEVTDAAASARAECAMLNKGPYIVETTRFLGDILGRMQSHQAKRRPTLRSLAVSQKF
jgi:pyruvate kinase